MQTKKKIKPTNWLLLGFFILATTISNAQGRKITGKVSGSDTGQTLPGATVLLKGSTKSTLTDFDGTFTINVNSENDVLEVSFVGYKTKEVTAKGNNLNIILYAETSKIDEIVVVGYGTRKKSDITGSVASVKSEQLTAYPVLSGEQALQGRAAGVAVQSNNGGEPGAPIKIRVRGGTSINASGDALIVVDGFVGASMPAPEDIASMDVLKDASATAIYGSRGSNGVILVTTKKGKSGKMNVEFSNATSIQEVNNTLKLLNADQYAAYRRNFPTISGTPAAITSQTSNFTQGSANTDWQDVIFRAGLQSNTQLSFSGGSDKIKYYVSGNYFKQEGVVINSGLNRYTILSNIDAEITSKLKIGLNLFGSRISNDGIISQTATGGAGAAGVVSSAYRFRPDLGIRDANGVFTLPGAGNGDEIDNPFAIATENVNNNTLYNTRSNSYLTYEIVKNLEFKTSLGLNYESNKNGRYQPSTVVAGRGVKGIATINDRNSFSVLNENYLTYNKKIGKGKLTALAGYSYQKNTIETSLVSSSGFVNDDSGYYNLGAGVQYNRPDSNLDVSELVSTFGRLNFDFDDRYLLTITGRRDGASAFSKNNKYAFFPSGAIGWNISKESFLKNSKVISNLKLRASYGLTGNPGISPYETIAKYSSVYSNVGDVGSNAAIRGDFANDNLKWETTYQTNLGIDLGFFDSRFNLSADLYKTITKDLLFSRPLPGYYGVPFQTQNIGELENKGLEFTLNTKNIIATNFSWSTDFNISFNKNKILKLPDNNADLFYTTLPGSFGSANTQVLRVGEPVGLFYGYIYDGVTQTKVDVVNTLSTFDSEPGGQLLRDINGDKRIDSRDLTVIGDPNPDYIAGLTNDFRYKNLDLNIFFQASVGGEILNYTILELTAGGGSNATTEAINSWTTTNTNTDVPRALIRPRSLISTRFVYDASYIRLKNISLGYSMPKDLVSRVGLDKVRLFASAQNILTFTEYPGSDPEVNYRNNNNANSNRNLGLDYGSYPNIKSYTLGVNIKF
jgi:TonB-dependent starch-binding outer membrane protein SusC